jgi:hypothetical protein
MEVEQIMAHLRAEIRTNRERMNANIKKNVEDMRAWRKEITACQGAMEACREIKEQVQGR